jgi:ankyrin repeat protein
MALDISYDTGLLRGLSIGHVAAAHGHASSMMAWIAAGGDLQRRSDNGSSMGHIAAERDRLEVLAAWIRAGGDVHARDVRGRTIGHVCASLPCLDQWMSAGGDINALDFSGRTIGHAAGADGHVDVCQAWLQHATTVTPVDHDGSTVLHHIMDPCRGIQIMDAWIARGGDIHICNHRHESIGFHLLDRGAMSWCTAWINRGGCILDGIRHPDVHMLMTRHGDDGEGMVVTRAFLRMADGACTITDHERQAMHGPIGRPLAQRLMLHAQDPVHLARFIQAWESIP